MKDCVNCKNKNWLRVINKPFMECFLTKEQFTLLESKQKAEDCKHYDNEANYDKL